MAERHAALFDDLARLHDLCGPWDLVHLDERGSFAYEVPAARRT